MENTGKKQVSEIHFIRHGNTEGTEKRWFYGAADIPLSNAGVNELQELAEAGIYPCMDLTPQSVQNTTEEDEAADFYTSGMLRAEQTFFLIYGLTPHQTIPELKEISFGEFECKSHEELSGTPKYEAWLARGNEGAAPPGGESVAEFSERVLKGYNKLLGYHQLKELSHRHSKLPAHSVVVCHGGVIGGLLKYLFPEENKNLYEWLPKPGHGYTLIIESGKAVGYREF